MAIDYTTSANVLAYGKSQGGSAGEPALLVDLVTAVSRKVDEYCHQNFSAGAVTDERVYALIDAAGVLLAYPPVPTVSTISAATLRVGNTTTTTDLVAADWDIENRHDGAILRLFGRDYRAQRSSRPPALVLSYTGGWTDLDDVPADFEWLVRRACWWEYKKREAPMEKTAIPEMGMVIVPQSWPIDLIQGFGPYMRTL
jgi:hypothetical protein